MKKTVPISTATEATAVKPAAPEPVPVTWERQNQQFLVREFEMLRRRLGENRSSNDERENALPVMHPPAAIDQVTAIFDLSPFERAILLMLAGLEMDPPLARLCSEAAGRQQRSAVTFSLALATLENPHWSAMAPSSPLRHYRLIEMEQDHGLTSAPLHIDERLLHYLAGVNHIDTRLQNLLIAKSKPGSMAEEHFQLAGRIMPAGDDPELRCPVLHLCGDDDAAQENVACLLAHRANCELFVLRLEDTPSAGVEMDQFRQIWARESLLLPACLLLQWEGDVPTAAALQLAERLPGMLIVASRDPIRLHRPIQRFEVSKPGPSQQKHIWADAFGDLAQRHPALLGEIAEQFRFSAETIVSIAHSALAGGSAQDSEALAERLWSACRSHGRPRLEAMAERIVPSASWTDLVLPEPQLQILHQLVSQARHRMTVYETWGFAAKGRRGLGLSVLFSGPSGTGKTLAAEVLASELKLDLYRIDLSAVVSKYIGETEKNLKQVFDAAETGGVLLLFDEADALFGKRAEVKDSHDRYANIEVGYLLQRMESFQGLAILTTNLKSSLDKSFQRRLRFTVEFNFPDAAQRAAIWSRVFPGQTPTSDLDPVKLATLNMTGGNIRNIALNAAFLAAECNDSVRMTHLLQAAQLEAAKVERPIAEMETRGWV
jgi:hypothetical protein